jgi:hypothetical protein
VRAPGILEDVGLEHGPRNEIVTSRVAGLAALVETHPLPPDPPQLAAVRDFLIAVPDSSRDHKFALRAVREQIDRVRRAQREREISQFWQIVADATRDSMVRPLVEAEMNRAAVGAADLEDAADRAVAELRLDRSPWMRLANELQALPLFSQMPPAELLKGVVAMLSVGYSIAPGIVDEIRVLIDQGGLKAVRAKIRELAREDRDVDVMGLPSGRPSDWKKPDWRLLMQQFVSKAEAARALTINVRTIDRNLKRLRLRWKRSP